MSRATESSSTSSAQGPAGKPGVESFSYVEPAALRFVVDLPIAPTTPPEGPAAVPSDAGLSTSTSSSHAMAGASSGSAAAMPTQSALHGLAPAHARANKPPHSTYSATPTLASSAAPDSTDGLVRTNSKGRRRLSVSLTNLLHPGKRDRRRTDDSSTGGTSTPGSVSLRTLDGRTGMQSSRAASVASPTASRRASIDEHADPSVDPSRSRRSPDLIDSQPRQQDTAGRDRCGLLEECRAASNSSQGSLDAVATNSNASTAPTSPDALASQDCDEDEFVSPAERRRRGSLALAKQLRDDGREDETEDLTEFLRASGSPSTSPVPHSGPFVRRPSGASSPTPPSLAAFPPPFTSAIATTSGTASPPLHPRRLTRNIEGLSLGDLRHSPPPATRRPVLPSVAASPFTVTSVPQPEPRPSRASSGRAQLGAMPRLLSTNAIATVDTHEDEQEDSESESDSQDGQSEEDDEGETYETSDEGPVTIRSSLATPAASPLASSSQPRTPGFGPPLSTNPSLRNSRLPSLTHLAAAGASAAPSQSSWVSFATAIPTPSTIRDLRAAGPSNGPSYFDLPRPSSSCTAKTPLVPPQTPLVPMSISEIARGKRPALQEDVEAAAAAVQAGPSTSEASDRAATGHDGGVRGGLYRLRSQSVVQLASPSMVDAEDQPVGTAALTELDPVWRSGAPAKQRTPAPSFLSFNLNQRSPQSPATSVVKDAVTSTPTTPAPLDTAALPAPTTSASPAPVLTESPTTARSRPATGTPGGHRLQRTRSMYELRDAPPPYNAVYRKAGLGAPQIVHPREEEGCEGLPPYTCAIHIEGYMPRKMEFTAPGIQARDRAWKRQYFVLHGTSIKIYKYDLRTHPIPGEEDWSTVPVDIAGHDGPPPLHFHEGEYGVAKEQSANHKFPLSITDAKAKAKDRIITSATASAQNSLVRHYSLQNAESGLAADYVKRKHVVRVRAEGEQFLLQAKDDRGVIDLIEALQAATNVALDLDARPLPKFITLPRRRRRRRPRPDANAAAAPAANGASATANGATATATAGAAAAEGPTETDRMGDMLAEEQNSYARRSSATVM